MKAIVLSGMNSLVLLGTVTRAIRNRRAHKQLTTPGKFVASNSSSNTDKNPNVQQHGIVPVKNRVLIRRATWSADREGAR